LLCLPLVFLFKRVRRKAQWAPGIELGNSTEWHSVEESKRLGSLQSDRTDGRISPRRWRELLTPSICASFWTAPVIPGAFHCDIFVHF
jgi:hypothetical protein